MLAEGTLLDGKYEIRGQLATGGMGEVYLAHRTMLGDNVAVKVIRRTGPDPSVWRERFLRESRACAQLRHPHIVTILDFNIDPQGQPYLVMEYLNGPSLYEELKARDRFDLASVQHLLATIGSALYLAHSTGIVHRDLKPQNIVSHRFETGEVVHKVIDFGLVTLKTEVDSTRLTQAHEFLGTVAYSAPEQFMEAAPDPKADQYSLGVIIYELLAGVRPIEGDGFMVLVDRHIHAAPMPLADRRPDLPAKICDAVMRALAKKPDQRWPTVMDFARAFDDADSTARRMLPQPVSALLGTFELGPVIAQGRFGSEIHAGTHRALGHPVAIRTFRHAGRADREAVRARFLREARTLQVPHPNLIQVRDFGEDAEMVYVVTDLLQGCSLAELMAHGPLPLDQVSAFVGRSARCDRGAASARRPDLRATPRHHPDRPGRGALVGRDLVSRSARDQGRARDAERGGAAGAGHRRDGAAARRPRAVDGQDRDGAFRHLHDRRARVSDGDQPDAVRRADAAGVDGRDVRWPSCRPTHPSSGSAGASGRGADAGVVTRSRGEVCDA